MSPLQAPGGDFTIAMAGSVAWGDKTRPIEKREGDGALAKDDDQGLENQNNNQMEVSVAECKEFGRTRTHSGTLGGIFSFCFGGESNDISLRGKIRCRLSQRLTTNIINNQPGTRKIVDERGKDKGVKQIGMPRECDSIVLGFG